MLVIVNIKMVVNGNFFTLIGNFVIAKPTKKLYNETTILPLKENTTMVIPAFGERLAQLMESYGYTIKTLSEEIGMTPATLSRYTKGGRNPEISYILTLAEFFQVSVDWLLGLNDDRYDSLPADMRELVKLYTLASADDRKVIQVVLEKYKKKE